MIESVLPDVLELGLRIVFCGSAAGKKSAQVGAYYAGPGNRFWDVLYRVGLTPRRLAPQDFRIVTRFGFGLTDVAKAASGADHQLAAGDFDSDNLRLKIAQFSPRVLAFNGKRAAQAFYRCKRIDYGLQPEKVVATAVFVLPSTSGAARRYWDETHWRTVAEFVS